MSVSKAACLVVNMNGLLDGYLEAINNSLAMVNQYLTKNGYYREKFEIYSEEDLPKILEFVNNHQKASSFLFYYVSNGAPPRLPKQRVPPGQTVAVDPGNKYDMNFRFKQLLEQTCIKCQDNLFMILDCPLCPGVPSPKNCSPFNTKMYYLAASNQDTARIVPGPSGYTTFTKVVFDYMNTAKSYKHSDLVFILDNNYKNNETQFFYRSYPVS